MNRFDLCVLVDDVFEYRKETFAIILDMDEGNYYHIELWDFERFAGANLNYIDKKHLRIATEEEKEIFQQKFKEYCDSNDNTQY